MYPSPSLQGALETGGHHRVGAVDPHETERLAFATYGLPRSELLHAALTPFPYDLYGAARKPHAPGAAIEEYTSIGPSASTSARLSG